TPRSSSQPPGPSPHTELKWCRVPRPTLRFARSALPREWARSLTLTTHAALLDDVGELASVHEVHFGPRRPLRISAASDGSYPALRNRLARCRYGQIFCGRPPAPTLLTCEKRAQMTPHPCSRGIGQSPSAR